MKHIRKFAALVLALAMGMSLVACGEKGGEASGGDDTVYTITAGGTVPEEHPISQGMMEFERVAEELSGGRIQVETYVNNTLGGSRELVEAVQAGELQMCETSQSMYAS